MSDEYTLPVNDDIYITGETEEVVPNFSEIDDDDSTQETVTRTPAVISSDNRSSIGSGELNPSPSDAVPADVSTSDVIVTQRVRHQIDDYEPAALKALSDAGAVFYAVYADDHEEGPVSWTEVHDLDPEGTIIELDEEIASAIAQNFWADTQGVHITDDPYNEWIEAYESNPQFPNLSTTKNYYNILLNAGGALLRRALNNLVSINRTAISFYDGLGNASTNIMAFFGRNGAQIGRSDEKHVVINSSGIGSYNGDGTVADFTMRGSSIVNSTISGSALVDNTITGGKIANATITGAKIDSGTITNANIQDGTITGAKIDAGTITNANIQDGTIQGSKIQGSTLTDIPFAAITDAEVEVASIADAQISTATISEAQVENLTTDYAHLTQGVIDNAKIDHADVNGLSANYATISNLNAATGRIGALEADHVSVEDFEAEQGYIDALQAATADIGTIRADSAKVHSLTAAQLSAATGYIAALNADNITAASLSADVGKIHNLTANELSAAAAYIAALNADSVTAQNIIAMNGDFATVKANAAKVANLTAAQLEADHATIGALDTTYAQINMANVNNAWITNGVIKDGAISSAMINDVSANKLTAGTINGSVINVTNLNADNITTGTINGQRIGEGSLSLDKLSDDVYTEAEVDAKLSTMQSQIDGAIETWTGTAVPTLQNSPASSWNTTALKDSHVGDVYFVVNSQSQQNGYNYRFTKSGSTYSWQLIKDSDVTNALQRLTTAEGKITTFDSDISQLKTDTGTLTTKTTSLETRMSDAEADILDKVDTTTFNEVSDTVDSHSQSITQMTTTLSNKADSSTVSAVTQRVSKNEQDISGINTTIGELETTVESKADGSTVETMSTKLNTVSDTVDGHTQSISSINSTLSTKADSSTVSTLTTKVNNVSDTVEGHTSQLSSITQTQTSIQKNAVKSTVQLWFTKADTTAPAKPTAHVSTNNAATGNAWNLAVPTYNSAYPNYYYCYEYQYVDGSYGWSAVTRDIATGEMQATARQAQDNINNLELGGRNLVIDSMNFRVGATAASTLVPTVENGMYKMVVSEGNSANWSSSWWPNKDPNWSNVENNLSDGDQFVISFLMRAVGSTTKPTIYIKPGMGYYSLKGSLSEDWSVVYYTGTWIDNETIMPHLGWSGISVSSTYYIKSVKVERGNKPTDWTPAPEDVDADISTAQTSADNAQATADKNIKESQQLWFTKANGSAPSKPASKVTSTSTGGNAWTTKVPTYNENYPHYFYCMQYIAADGTVTWSDVVYDQATTEAQSVARTTSANLTTLQQDYATFKQTTTQFESTIGSTYATKTELQTTDDKIDNLEIGGRNLLPQTGFNTKLTKWTNAGGKATIDTSIKHNGRNTLKLTTPMSSRFTLVDQYMPSYSAGDTLVFSMYVMSPDVSKITSQVTVYVAYRTSSYVANGSTQYNIPITSFSEAGNNGWFKITFTSSSTVDSNVYVTFIVETYSPMAVIYLSDLKLEKGNRATKWSPAPEDLDAAIDKIDRKTSVRLHLRRDNWTDSQWATYCSIGHADNFQNTHVASNGTGSATGFDSTTLNVGDLIVIEGISTGTNIPYSATAKVTSVPTLSTGSIPATVISANNAKAIESRVSTAETSIQQTNSQIALKANASDVYTKTDVNGLISTEVENRNSAIEQSADAINLSVSQTYTTKTEFNNLEIGGRNLAFGTAGVIVDKTALADGTRDEYFYFDLGQALPFGAGTPIVISFDLYMPIKTSGPSLQVYNTNNKGPHQTLQNVNVLAGKNLTVGSIVDERIIIKTSVHADRSDATLQHDYLEFYSVYGSNNYYRISNLKLEKGNKATDWTPAPEDMVSQTEFESAKSEIKATTDGITSTVSKISSVKYYTGGSSTLSNIKVWAAEGYTSTWTFTGDLSNLRIGDTVYLKYGDTTRGCNVYIKGTVNSISGQSVNFTAHGYEDVLPVDTIKSTINQSADSVKIEARHVNIEGAAIFSSGRLSETSLNNAYDTKGAAASLVAGGDNLIGGFNNSYVGNGEYNYRTGRFQSKTTLNTADNAVILQYYSGTTPTNAGTYVSQHADAFRVANVGETCSFKFEKPSGFTHLHLKFNGNQQDARVAWDVASIPVGTELILTFKLDSISSDGKGNGGVMSGINLRTGNMPSQWSLAPDDVDVATSADLNTVKSNAVKRTQRIYCRKSSVGAPSTPGISSSNWVTQTSDVFGQWTAKVPRLTANADGTGTKYLYLYTCEQREMGDGTLSYTTVLLDDSNTIIDGGTIITGSIAANKLDVYDASINKIRAESIDLRGYSNDEIEVGGRNLLLFSQFLSKDGATVYGYGSSANTYGFDGTYKGCTVWSATKTKTSGSAEMLTADAAKVSAWVVGPNESYILSFWAKASAEIGITSYFYRGENNTCNLVETSTGYVGTSSDGSATLSIGTGWKRYWVRWHFNDNTDPSLRKNLIIARAQASTTGTVWIAGPKLEKGNKATDWTPAPEDVEADISSKADPDDIPTKVSDLTNDSGFQNSSEVETAITSKGYATQNSLNSEINQRKAQYGTCSTAAATQAKEVTCSNFELVAGNELTVKFSTANTYASGAVQLNVNSKGAKNVWVANAVTSSSNQLLWGADAYITFRYDGTQFIVIGEPRAWYGASTTAEGTAAKTDTTAVTGCVICKGAKVELAMTNANTATAPTLNIQSTGAKNVYFGNGTARPTKANGTSWLATNTCTFTFDGQYWRTAGKTYIDANSIVTGYLSADRIEAGSLSANKISATSGTFDTANIPDLSAAKIVTGYLSADRIEAGSLSANKISAASGTFDTANIPNLDAAKITSGTIDAARINASALTIDSQTLGVSIGRLNNIVTAGDDEDDVVFTEDALSAMGRNVHVSAGNVDISTDESTGNVTSLTDTLGMLATTDQVDELDNSVTNLLDNVSNVQDYVNPLTSWINITEVPTSGGGTEPALQMGTTEGNAPVMQLTNSMLQFRMLGDANPLLKMGVVDGESLLEIMKAVVLKELRFNNFAFIARPNGNVCLKYIGRD